MADARFSVDYSKRLSKCKKCKKEIDKGDARIAKVGQNVFASDDSEMKNYYHIECLFETFKRARATTKTIESADDIEGFKAIKQPEKDLILSLIKKNPKKSTAPAKKKPTTVKKESDDESSHDDDDDDKKKNAKKRNSSSGDEASDEESSAKASPTKVKKSSVAAALKEEEDSTDVEEEQVEDDPNCADNSFEKFHDICQQIADESGHNKKTAILQKFFKHGSSGTYRGNMYLFLKLLLPSVNNRVYNLNSKQLVKLFAQIFSTDLDDMLAHLNQGDVAETVRHFFAKSESSVKPAAKSTLTLAQVDAYLDKLTQLTKEHEQLKLLEQVARKCTKRDLRSFVRLIKKDLAINAGTKVIMDAVDSRAYEAFNISRNLEDVVKRAAQVAKARRAGKPGDLVKELSVRISLMTPVKPMLADACKSAEQAMLKCKNGLFAEIKYDGERLQVHKSGGKFSYFSRNLKQVPAHKVEHLKEYIPKAFPSAQQLILDGEVLLYDTKTKKPLPFGTLGVHKKNAFKDATVCYFVFDCMYLNGESLMHKSMAERRKLLEQNMTEIPGRIMFSQQTEIAKAAELKALMMKTIKEGLEGLVLKDKKSVYEPGKRHWLKMKKDYLDDGSMADTADLVVMGAYYGTGNKGGLKSVFLMGTYDTKTQRWRTVTKVGNGFDDKTLMKLQKSIDMVEINKSPAKVPDWLDVHRSIVPDFVVKDPKKAPVWEIVGAEFSTSSTHTADGISIRFPRVTRVRDDKSWKEATDLARLKELFKISKEKTDIMDDDEDESTKKKKRSAEADDDDDDVEERVATSPKKKGKGSPSSSTTKPITNYFGKRAVAETIDSSPPAKQLAAIFTDCTIFLPKSIDKFNDLRRHIVAYDGDVITDEKLIDDASHVVLDPNDSKAGAANTKAKVVTQETLWRSIKEKKNLIN